MLWGSFDVGEIKVVWGVVEEGDEEVDVGDNGRWGGVDVMGDGEDEVLRG